MLLRWRKQAAKVLQHHEHFRILLLPWHNFLSNQSGWFTHSSHAIGKAPQVMNYPKWRYDAGLCVDDVLRHICIWAGEVRAREDIELTRLDKVTIVHKHLVI